MADSPKVNNGPDAPRPVCPHCLADPCIFTITPVNFRQLQTIAVYCGNPECRKVFAVSFIGIHQPPQIVMPGMQLPPKFS